MKNDGEILGVRVRIYADLRAYFYLSTPAAATLASERLAGPYKTLAMGVEALGVITNAVMDALYSTGVRHIDPPLTPEKIRRALNR